MSSKKPLFRAVKADGVRRGLSLEPVFWNALEDIAKRDNLTNGMLIAKIAEHAGPQSKNLSSEVRSYLMDRMSQERSSLEEFLSLVKVSRLVHACPAPCFILSVDKRILSYNKAFVGFLQLRFATVESGNFLKSLILTLDIPIERTIENLKDNSASNVTSGFSIGMSGQSVRGQLSLVYIEISGTPSVISYITE